MENQKHNASLRPQTAPALRESAESKNKLDNMLLGCFTAQKLYGREAEGFELISPVFQQVLGKYPADKVVRALEIWMERKTEFPTPADIAGLIKRNGKEAVTKEVYINISKMDGADRRESDWQLMREYEAQQRYEENGFAAEEKQADYFAENQRLKQVIAEKDKEYARLAELLESERLIRNPPPTPQDKIQKTIDYLKETGVSESDINAFILESKVA